MDIPDGWITRDLLLLVTPLWQLLPRRGEDAFVEVVSQLELGRHGLDDVALFAVQDLHAPDVISVALAIL